MTVRNVVIVGCGRIAGGTPPGTARLPYPGHADAYTRHPAFRLLACVEPDATRRQTFQDRWQIPHGFASLDACLSAGMELDVASVCAPTETHVPILQRLLDSPVHAVLCEKPLADRQDAAEAVAAAYAQAGKVLAVAYLRRWSPAMVALRDEFADGVWGAVRTVVGFYTKGIRHNGAHLVDLLRFMFGPVAASTVTGVRRDGLTPDDLNLDAVLTLGDDVRAHLVGTDHRDYALFEVHIVAERGAVTIERSGRTVRRRRLDPAADPHFAILDRGVWDDDRLGDPLLHALDNLDDAINTGAPLMSDAANAVATESICDHLIKIAKDID
jgi:predicted dehydrogenase